MKRKWKPASAEWIAAFTAASRGLGEPRKMFGYPAAFANGNMFAGLHEAGLILRLPEMERDAFLRQEGAKRFEPLPGRVMREYVVAPDVLANEPGLLRRWLRTAFGYAGSLPPKAARTRDATRAARRRRT
jgi:TfoX/Sxy family transcriptional regulator of competence genes